MGRLSRILLIEAAIGLKETRPGDEGWQSQPSSPGRVFLEADNCST
jgi:hypothetical protein